MNTTRTLEQHETPDISIIVIFILALVFILSFPPRKRVRRYSAYGNDVEAGHTSPGMSVLKI
jgi:hypothetical protein